MVRRLDVRAAHQVDPARVDHDQRAPSRSRCFIRDAKTGWASVGLAPISSDHVGLVDRAEVLGAGGGAERLLEAVAGRGVADPRAGVDVVVAERRPHHLLDDVDLLVGAAAGGDAADRADAVLGLDRLEALGDRAIASSHVTSRHSSSIVSRTIGAAPVLVGGVAVGEAALDAGVALVGAAVLVRDHPDDLASAPVALDLGLERAADAAVGAGGRRPSGSACRAGRPSAPGAPRSGRPARRRRRRRTRTP